MSTLSQRISHAADPGYWAVEIRLAEGAGLGKRYLCHAENSQKAFAMAVQLSGSERDLRGVSCFWIDEDGLDVSEPERPVMGAYAEVRDTPRWYRLLHAHDIAEKALARRQADASA